MAGSSGMMDNYRTVSEVEGVDCGFGKFSVTIIPHYNLQMRDGVNLSLKIWFPFNDVKYTTFEECEHKLVYHPEEPANAVPQPSIIEYLPYRKSDVTLDDDWRHLWMSTHGYVCVRIDLRGTGDSEGLCLDEHTEQEIKDGLEVIEWLGDRPWCNGDVGVYGRGWGGTNGLLLAAKQPPGLRAVISLSSTDDRYAVASHYLGGCILANEQVSRASKLMAWNARPPNPRHVSDWRAQWRMRLEQASESWLGTWLQHRNRDKYWERSSIVVDPQMVMVPVLLIGGWQDHRAGRVMRMASTLPRMRGIIGPWGTEWPDQYEPGPTIDLLGHCLAWWDEHLKGIGTSMYQTPLLRVFIQEAHGSTSRSSTEPRQYDRSVSDDLEALKLDIDANRAVADENNSTTPEIQICPAKAEVDAAQGLTGTSEITEADVDTSGLDDVLEEIQLTPGDEEINSDISLLEIKPDAFSVEPEMDAKGGKIVYRSKSHTEWYVPLGTPRRKRDSSVTETPEDAEVKDLFMERSNDFTSPEKETYNFVPETEVRNPPPDKLIDDGGLEGTKDIKSDYKEQCVGTEKRESASGMGINGPSGHWVALHHWPPQVTGSWVDFAPSNDGGLLWLLTVGERDASCDSKTWSVPYSRGHGVSAGDWGCMTTGSGPAGPQQIDDGLCLTWTSRALEEDLVILGQPRLCCRVCVSGGTQGMLATRLCHVTPEGVSHRISFAVHNLTHRLGHHESVPLKDGEAGDLAITMAATSYTVPKGHRVRLALSQSYWPLLWPPQKALKMDIEVGQLQGFAGTYLTLLTIPVFRETEENRMESLDFVSSRKPAPSMMQTEKPGSSRSMVEWSPTDGRYCIRSKSTSDRVTVQETGTTMEESVEKSFLLKDESPTSARVSIDHHVTHEYKDVPGGGDICCDIKTHTQMWSSTHTFSIHNSLDVSLNGEAFFGESWNSTIPRTGV